jgi:hypothetical protein
VSAENLEAEKLASSLTNNCLNISVRSRLLARYQITFFANCRLKKTQCTVAEIVAAILVSSRILAAHVASKISR